MLKKIMNLARPVTGANTWVGAAQQQVFEDRAKYAQKAITGGQVQEVHNASNAATVRSPMNMGTGIVQLPQGMPVSSQIKVTIDTDNAAQEQEIVLGIGDIYKYKGNSGWTQNPANTVFGSTNTGSYDLFLKDLCNTTYHFHTARIEVFKTANDSTDGTNALEQLYEEWLYVTGDVQDAYMTRSIDIRDSIDAYQQRANVTNYQFKMGEGRLDNFSCFVLRNFRPNVRMQLRFDVTAVVTGRL
ncbi:MAG: hypothetical protein MK212_11895 [Saprospiraceae bacterium]|nr:hypothetical protein [Saprospiraceae bacterium]